MFLYSLTLSPIDSLNDVVDALILVSWSAMMGCLWHTSYSTGFSLLYFYVFEKDQEGFRWLPTKWLGWY